MMRLGSLVIALGALSACSSAPVEVPEPEPVEPPPAPPMVSCVVPEGMRGHEPAPERPEGDYTQRDVARYLVDLHHWGVNGWDRVETIDQWSERCVQRTGLRASPDAGSKGN